MSRLAEMFAAHALAGLCANPHHKSDEHPNTDSLAVVDRAFVLGKALAAKFAPAEAPTAPAEEASVEPKAAKKKS